MPIITCSKTYTDLPFAHRQHLHSGHCALIHGHNWSFTFEFGTQELDSNGFVIDFGQLRWLREELEELFDHTLVLNDSDPYLNYLNYSLDGCEDGRPSFAKVVVVPNCGAEGLARYVLERFDKKVSERTERRVFIASVTAHEDSRNSAKVRNSDRGLPILT